MRTTQTGARGKSLPCGAAAMGGPALTLWFVDAASRADVEERPQTQSARFVTAENLLVFALQIHGNPFTR